jgi:putative SOS response-associated peptidase YedK
VTAKPAFRSAFLKRRCLIPADGFYEWQPQGRTKQPFYFSDPHGQVLALAGLWEAWRAPNGDWLRTCCILTTAADERVAPVHERMPLILAPPSWAPWLAGPAGAAQTGLATWVTHTGRFYRHPPLGRVSGRRATAGAV